MPFRQAVPSLTAEQIAGMREKCLAREVPVVPREQGPQGRKPEAAGPPRAAWSCGREGHSDCAIRGVSI